MIICCVYSMICDHYWEKWTNPVQPTMPVLPPQQPPTIIPLPPTIIIQPSQPQITPEEIAEFKELLKKAKEYDEKTGQKDCGIDEKKEKIRKLAEQEGVEIEFP